MDQKQDLLSSSAARWWDHEAAEPLRLLVKLRSWKVFSLRMQMLGCKRSSALASVGPLQQSWSASPYFNPCGGPGQTDSSALILHFASSFSPQKRTDIRRWKKTPYQTPPHNLSQLEIMHLMTSSYKVTSTFYQVIKKKVRIQHVKVAGSGIFHRFSRSCTSLL